MFALIQIKRQSEDVVLADFGLAYRLLGGFFGLDDLLFLAGLFIFPLILFFVSRFVSKDVIFGLHGLIFRLRLFNFEQSLQVGGNSALDVEQLVFCLEGSLGRLEGTVADKA